MRKWMLVMLVTAVMAAAGNLQAAESAHRVGAGANYWVVLENLDDEDIRGLDEQGFSYFASYQYWPAILGFEAQLEVFPDWLGKDEAFAPQAYLLLGRTLYVGAGAGLVYFDEDWADDPFFALKGGLNLEFLPLVFLDLSANYRFNSESQFNDHDSNLDTDTVFLGAALRMGW